MSTIEMQSLLARLYVDEYCRQLFYHKPECVLDGYTLTKAEKEALLGINADRLDRHADGLLDKRERHMRPSFPFLFSINDRTRDREVVRLFRRFCGLHPEAPESSRDMMVQMFAAFIAQSLEGNKRMPPYSAEIARYDYVRYEVGHSEGAAAGGTDGLQDDGADEIRLEDVFETPPQVRVETFEYDVLGIVSELRQGHLPADVKKASTTVVLQNQDEKLRTFAVNGPTAILLNRIDGHRTVGENVEAVESSFGTTGLGDSIITLLHRLRNENVLVKRSAE